MNNQFGNKPAFNPNGDYEIQQGAPTNCISSISWSPKGCAKHLLVSTSWDKSVKVWDIQKSPPQPVVQVNALKGPEHSHDLPVLCSAIARDCRVFSAGCDKMVKCWELAAQGKAPYQVAAHDQPIKSVAYSEEAGLLITGGWDSLVKFWDLRQPQPAGQLQLPGPMVDMDCSTFPMATFMAPREVVVYDLQNKQELKRIAPHYTMKEHLRCIANFPDLQNPCFVAGSIEGRACIMYVNDSKDPKDTNNFSFKCHRENNSLDIYAVHSVSINPVFGTFSTTGGNGNYSFWDKDAKQRLKQFTNADHPIPCGKFDSEGTLFGYAVSYDWSKGAEGFNPQRGHHLLIHSVEVEEVKSKPPKPKTPGRGR
eukprot:NODE_2270_length_1228_cov_32.694823_g2158_i0.p1 GENE.NODE_2270_length_1228_cov_32.694823_g2158_i0~~NODE_2270_length_1228_cov_32.694823_g2158_i0.p1  ORF type:complete len:366 (-),score=91.27 NODE_2270_length_1228_cov_32.694823_g2158_i0:69-1166(-)